MEKLLIDEAPMQVLPSLAEKIGLEAAIVLQQIHFWVYNHQKFSNEKSFVDGKWWVFNTVAKWHENQFTWWSESTIKRILLSLEEMGLIESRRLEAHNRNPNQRKWYTTVPDAIAKLAASPILGWKAKTSELVNLVRSVTIGVSAIPERVNLAQSNGSIWPIPDQVNLAQSNGSIWPDDQLVEIKQLDLERSSTQTENPECAQSSDQSFAFKQEALAPVPVEPAIEIEQPQAKAANKDHSAQFSSDEINSTFDLNRMEDFLALYNGNLPQNWPYKEFLDMGEVIKVSDYINDIAHAGQLDKKEARAKALGRLHLALCYIRLNPEFYCKPTADGKELTYKGLNWLLGTGRQGRFINTLAELATAQNLNPQTISTGLNPQKSGIHPAVAHDADMIRWAKELSNPSLGDQRRQLITKLMTMKTEQILNHVRQTSV